MKLLYTLAGIVLLPILIACPRPPQMVGSWVNPQEAAAPVGKLMVINV
jgi:hypothetical protein